MAFLKTSKSRKRGSFGVGLVVYSIFLCKTTFFLIVLEPSTFRNGKYTWKRSYNGKMELPKFVSKFHEASAKYNKLHINDHHRENLDFGIELEQHKVYFRGFHGLFLAFGLQTLQKELQGSQVT